MRRGSGESDSDAVGGAVDDCRRNCGELYAGVVVSGHSQKARFEPQTIQSPVTPASSNSPKSCQTG